MSHFRLHTNMKEKEYLKYLIVGMFCLMAVAAIGYGIHSIGRARARSQETVLIYTEEEFNQYLVDQESEEYDLGGRYQLEENLDLSGLKHSIGTNIEPFTGRLNGNGHVIRGLARPLFGVMKEAEVENLFLSEAEIRNPFTYYDGEHYVDGYGALAAYVVDSVIRNCGMGGEIIIASPVEAEYQVAKASPAEALEEKGPGETEAVPGGEMTGEGGSGIGTGGGPGVESGTEEGSAIGPENAGGPGGESGTGESQESSGDMGAEPGSHGGPGIETETGKDQETSGDAGTEPGGHGGSGIDSETSGGTETVPEINGGTEPESGTAGGSETESGDGAETENEPETTGSQASELEGGIEGIETKGETEVGVEAEANGKSETDQEVQSGTDSGTNKEQKTDSGMETGSDHGSNRNTGSGQSAGKIGNGVNAEQHRQIEEEATAETVGYQSNDRQYLMMKVSTAPEVGPGFDEETDSFFVASPSDATPSDAEEEPEEPSFADGPEEPEFPENPAGDLYILVTADRIRSGGLVAEAAGNTLISDSFVLVTVGDRNVDVDSCAGGLAGTLGENTRTENSYASGLMDYPGMSGGFAAVNRGDIQNCYSTVTVGMKGTVRGAFVAEDRGTVTDCVYDRQMASVAEEMEDAAWVEINGEASGANAEPEFGVTGLEIAEMTGLEAQVPGNWYLADQAYPQIEYFAGSGDETISSYSKASVISLPLPSGVTLLELQRGSDIQLPSEVDGLTIQWDAKGEAIIDENNQVMIDYGGISISPNEVPLVEASLNQETEQALQQESLESEEMPAVESTATEGILPTEETIQVKDTAAAEEKTSSSIVLEATVGTATRTILGNIGDIMPAAAYADWSALGTAIYSSNRPAGGGTASNPFLLGTPENLAWFMVHVNKGNYSACAKLTADISLVGKNYGYTEASPMPWTVMALGSHGSTSGSYSGIFDGDFHTISSLAYTGSATQMGLIGVLNGVVKNLYIDNIKLKSVNPSGIWICIGGIAGQTLPDSKIEKCGILSGTVESVQKSNTGFMGIGGLVGDYRERSTIKDCFNRATVHNEQKNAFVGGIAGRAWGYGITNSYNIGDVNASDSNGNIISKLVDGIGFLIDENAAKPINCYIEVGSTTATHAKTLIKKDLQSWIACYGLNGKSKTGPWKYNEGNYPDFGHPNNSHTGTIGNPPDWLEIGRGIELGLMNLAGLSSSETGAADKPYHINTAEQLAQFAYKVNNGAPNLFAELTADINLSGTAYTGSTYDQSAANAAINALKWIPIGQDTSGNVYNGTFLGNGHVISQLHAEGEGKQGLFGTVSGRIRGTGIEGGYITGLEAGGIAGRLSGSASISRCFNRQNSFISSLSRANASNGGLVGLMSAGTLIEDSYNLNNTIAGGGTGARMGGIAGKMLANSIIQNSYQALGSIEATGSAVAGSITGDPSGVIRQCYRDKALAGDGAGNGISNFNMIGETTRQQETNNLNTLIVTGGTRERIGTERAWYTSLAAEKTSGLPTLVPPTFIDLLTVDPADSVGGRSVSIPTPLADAKFRGLRQETSDIPVFELTSRTDMTSNFACYGTDNASKKLGLATKDGYDFSSGSPSLINPTDSAGTISSLILYTAGGYNCAKDRVLLLDTASGGKRYEIRFAIKKTDVSKLSVVLPVKVVMEDLLPTGVLKRTYSPDLELRNMNKYPIEGKITGVTSKTGTGYVTLKPVAQSDPYGSTKQLTDPDGGVKLGIADTEAGAGIIPPGRLYYTPAKSSVSEKWMGYQLTGLGVLPYRYFIEYEGSHYPATNQYEYSVTYQFTISKNDVTKLAVE